MASRVEREIGGSGVRVFHRRGRRRSKRSRSRLERHRSSCTIRFAFLPSPATGTITNTIISIKPSPRPNDRHSHAAQHVRRHGLCREPVSRKLQEHVDSRGVQRQINLPFVNDHDTVHGVRARVCRGRRFLLSRNTSQIRDPGEIKQQLQNAFWVQREHSTRCPRDVCKQRQAPGRQELEVPETIPATFFPRQAEKGTLHIDVIVPLELRQLLRAVFVPRQERVRAPVPGDDGAQRSPLGLHGVLDVL